MEDQLKILFVLNKAMGHATYAAHLERVLKNRDDINPNFFSFKQKKYRSILLKKFNMSPRDKIYKKFDPISAYRGVNGAKIRSIVREFQPDIVHFSAHLPAASIAFEPSMPEFTVTLDCTRACMQRAVPKNVWNAADMAREGELFRRAARLYPWSSWAAASLVDDCGVPKSRIEVMPPSTETSKFTMAHHDKANETPRIVFIGNDFLRKGGDRLHRWATGPLADLCELHIVSGDPDAAVEGPNVVFHGRVPNDALVSTLLPQMDLLCHPTQSDMSAYVAVEASAAGLPCVASTMGGIPDLIAHGETGYLVAPDDEDGFVAALRDLLTAPERRKRMGEAAHARARQRLDASENYNRLVDQFRSLKNGAL